MNVYILKNVRCTYPPLTVFIGIKHRRKPDKTFDGNEERWAGWRLLGIMLASTDKWQTKKESEIV
jgi:hypothetical protein